MKPQTKEARAAEQSVIHAARAALRAWRGQGDGQEDICMMTLAMALRGLRRQQQKEKELHAGLLAKVQEL